MMQGLAKMMVVIMNSLSEHMKQSLQQIKLFEYANKFNRPDNMIKIIDTVRPRAYQRAR